jgi:hypothetical protein
MMNKKKKKKEKMRRCKERRTSLREVHSPNRQTKW